MNRIIDGDDLGIIAQGAIWCILLVTALLVLAAGAGLAWRIFGLMGGFS
jgi:hypothetical protein